MTFNTITKLGRHSKWSRSQSPFLLHFGNGLILVQINLQHSQAQPYRICTRVACIYLTQTHLYVEHHTEKQLVQFLKSLTRPLFD